MQVAETITRLVRSRGFRSAIKKVLVECFMCLHPVVGARIFSRLFGLYGLFMISRVDEIRQTLRRPVNTWKFGRRSRQIALRTLLNDGNYRDVIEYFSHGAFENMHESSDVGAILVAYDFEQHDVSSLIVSLAGTDAAALKLLEVSAKMREVPDISLDSGELRIVMDNRDHFVTLPYVYIQNGMMEQARTIWKNLIAISKRELDGSPDFYYLSSKPWSISIGHYVFLDAFIKAMMLGMIDEKPIFLEYDPMFACNMAMHEIFTDILRGRGLLKDSADVGTGRVMGIDLIETTDGYAEISELQHMTSKEWHKKRLPSLVSPSGGAKDRIDDIQKLGIPEGAWFVTLHVRENGYRHDPLGETGNGRDADIKDYLGAVSRIVEQGGFVVRCGDRSMSPMAGQPGLVDYAHSKWKSPHLDVFLIEHARFHIGTNSGLSYLPIIFDIPTVFTNIFPLLGHLNQPSSVSILQLVWSGPLGRYLTLEEMADPHIVGVYGDTRLLCRHGLTLVKNEPALLEATIGEVLAHMGSGKKKVDRCWTEIVGRKVEVRSAFRKDLSLNLSTSFINKYGSILGL